MKKLYLLAVILVSVLLTSCTETAITCGEGLIMEDNVCVIVDPVEDETEDVVEVILPNEMCETSVEDYNVTDYDMVWNDEFDIDGSLDLSKWEYQIGNGSSYGIPGWGNGEEQYYTNDLKNVEIVDGVLRITATTEGIGQFGYTSGRIRTADLGDFKYGIIEVCAMLPDTLGTWPAIWMLPTDSPYGGWPSGGEIDIMEAVGFENDKIHFNIHTLNDNWGTSRSIGSDSYISNIDTEFHAYAILWDDSQIAFYVDGVERFVYTPENDSYEYWPFDQEFHLLMNIAVGGAWGGIRGIEEGNWEDSMYVDYVRVYQEN